MDQFARARALLPAVLQLRRWTIFGLLCTGAAAAVTLIGTTLLFFELDDLELDSGTAIARVDDDAFFDLYRFTTRAAGVMLVALVVTGAVFLAWLWKAREMAADLRNRVPDGDAWITLGWLPLVNLAVPYSLVSGVYGDADPDVQPGDEVEHRSGRAWWLFGLWWAPAFVVLLAFDLRLFAILGRPVRLVVPDLTRADVGTITSTLLVDVIVLACMTIASVGAILVVRRVTTRLEQCVARFGKPVAAPPVQPQSSVTAAASHAPE